MQIIKIPVGYLEANCYIVFSKKNRDAVIIDPGGDADLILSAINKNQLKPLIVINTHNHFDHIGANKEITERFKINLFVPDKDGQIEIFGSHKIKFILTPGHTSDGICLHIENHLFSGDTLFAGSIGRTDIGGNTKQILQSIKTRIFTLPKETIVHPGHGPDTTVEEEMSNNPFFNG
ncbi:MAG: hypothetical protein A2474_00230 [Elusimicrobia bacterium RIFOXYC2_FULL_34_12]|nr:MAG: hypothetical protein A2474_00230 [Elusimicrobia bacterium RIFOXYC2_FULL_34_12]OGS38637.1 MAG: hypothetical protein A2551_06425 [Elusimicrobia bacterium RIFOXYD2_FULL_34_30]HAM39470.1 MBL fold metallo-hydrolase [Elusimicrobiota bacterium]